MIPHPRLPRLPGLVLGLISLCLLGTTGARAAAKDSDDDDIDADPASVQGGIDAVIAKNPADDVFWEALLLLESKNDKDQAAGRAKLREAADRDHPLALRTLAELHMSGSLGMPKNARRAFQAYRGAVDSGYSPAKFFLALCHHLGKGTRKDPEQARKWFEAALADASTFRPPVPPRWFFERRTALASSGGEDAIAGSDPVPEWERLCAASHFYLGEICDAEKDQAAATKHFEAAATWGAEGRAGIYDAATRAAMRYALGRGVPGNLKRANELLDQSRSLNRGRILGSLRSLVLGQGLDDFTMAEAERSVEKAIDENFSAEQQSVANTLLKDRPAEAVRWCELAAESGETWAMLLLGEIHHAGLAGAVDDELAFRWYKRAAEEKDSELAWGNLAACLRDGIGTAADPEAAGELTKKRKLTNFICMLVSQGTPLPKRMTVDAWKAILDEQARTASSPEVLYHWAVMQDNGSRTADANGSRPKRRGKGPDPIFQAMKRAADAGLPEAHLRLGLFYLRGAHTVPDRELAYAEFKQGTLLSNSECANQIGLLFVDRGVTDPVNRDRLVKSFRFAVQMDPENGGAHNNLAVTYEKLLRSPETLADEEAKDACRKAMIRHYTKAKELGVSLAALNLGRIYLEGEIVPYDFDQAYDLLQQASEEGTVDAHLILARLHDRGIGVPVTPKEAANYYRLAAYEGNREAMVAIANAYYRGRGVPRDLTRAAFWYNRLARVGQWDAVLRLNNTNDRDAIVRLGDILVELGMHREALRYWKSLTLHPWPMWSGWGYERLAEMYEKGLGTKPNPKRAASYLQKALESGNCEAVAREGLRLIRSGESERGLDYLDRAKDAGSHEAALQLAQAKLEGRITTKDAKGAIKLLREAAEALYPPAMLALARCALDEVAGAPTFDEALLLAEGAASAGATEAAALQTEIENRRDQHATEPAPTIDSRARST